MLLTWFIRFLRRNEGVEAARKYFLDARKSPKCSYHVYVAYGLMAFCLDKDPKIAHNVFEAGLKRFMHEPAYILEYIDFLSRLNDDRNIRALFERALTSLPSQESIEVWKQFTQFEKTYGDLASMLKVEQRRKDALSGIAEDGSSAIEDSLQDVVSRYSFMDLWPCSSKDLDHLARQEWLTTNVNKKMEKSVVSDGLGTADKAPSFLTSESVISANLIYPDTSQMVVYDPRQKLDAATHSSTTMPGSRVAPNAMSNLVAGSLSSGPSNAFDDILKSTPPALVSFLANLPIVEGPTPNVEIVLSVCLQSELPATTKMGKLGAHATLPPAGPASTTSDLSGSSKSYANPSVSSFKTRDRLSGKRKDIDEDDESATVQSQPLPRDAFRIRQIQRARTGIALGTRTTSQTGSASYGSALSGDLSGSTG